MFQNSLLNQIFIHSNLTIVAKRCVSRQNTHHTLDIIFCKVIILDIK